MAEAQLSVNGANSTRIVEPDWRVLKGGPCVDHERGGSLEAKVRNYQLAALAPLLRSAASDIKGPVNGFIAIRN